MTDRERALVEAMRVFAEWRDGTDTVDAEELVACHPELAELLRPLVGLESSEERPVRIGPYSLIEVLGEGGMGTVWLAEQTEPVRRRVALKILKSGLGRTALVRFEAERQALAVMDHPSIARIFDAGMLDDGRPYFVMEHVAGESLDVFCDQHRLTVRERLELFVAICHGVQHAHQKGIVHRDLKPTNIVVRMFDREAVPKIIDFGVAKALEQQLTEQAFQTIEGRILGTPLYMSPEQASPSAQEIDTRSDIYSLGVVLYELLAGAPPFDASVLSRGYEEFRRVVCEVDPPRPSTRITSVSTQSASVAEQRRVDLLTLTRTVRGDLDWITLKSIEKDPAHRYQSASELAADIERYLRDEPVLAGPPTASYRLRKWIRRNRGIAIGVAAAVLALAIGFVVSLAFFLDARTSATLAARRLGEVLDLSTISVLDELRRRADEELWPIAPETLPAIDRWLVDAESLVPTRVKLSAALAALRAQAEPQSAEDRQRDTERSPVVSELHELRNGLAHEKRELDELRARTEAAAAAEVARGDVRIRRLKDRIRELESRRGARRTYRFRDGDGQTGTQRFWRHGVLTQLVEQLEQFCDGPASSAESHGYYGTSIPEVRARRRQCLAVAGLGSDGSEHERRWREVRKQIRSSPRYGGLDLAPQTGLVPLRENRRTGLFEFADVRTGEVPTVATDGALRVGPDTGILFVLLPGAEFLMGAQAGDPAAAQHDRAARGDEAPHRVRLAPFFLGKHEVTQGQWLRVAGTLPSRWRAGFVFHNPMTVRHPVEQVSWRECQVFLARLGMSLPTEAQWEYACRAGTTTPWWTGARAETLANVENVADWNHQKLGFQNPVVDWKDGYGVHWPVGRTRANPFGLFDMHGNVAEWCRDTYGPYGEGPPHAPGDGYRYQPSEGRLFRGGSYADLPRLVRSSARSGYVAEEAKYNYLGVRAARAIER